MEGEIYESNFNEEIEAMDQKEKILEKKIE